MLGKYVPVSIAVSKTRPGTHYTISRHVETGLLSCDCKAWIFSKTSPKTCKHILALSQQAIAQSHDVVTKVSAQAALKSKATVKQPKPFEASSVKRRIVFRKQEATDG